MISLSSGVWLAEMSSPKLHRFFSRPRQNFEPAFDQELLWIAARALNPAILFPAAHTSTGRTHILRGDGKVFG
jgi:hypothetical protein